MFTPSVVSVEDLQRHEEGWRFRARIGGVEFSGVFTEEDGIRIDSPDLLRALRDQVARVQTTWTESGWEDLKPGDQFFYRSSKGLHGPFTYGETVVPDGVPLVKAPTDAAPDDERRCDREVCPITGRPHSWRWWANRLRKSPVRRGQFRSKQCRDPEERKGPPTMSDQPDPLYVHDGCPRCTYLGTWENSVDLWFCPQVGFPIVIARFSSEHFDYTSGINSWSPALVEAKTRAAERGLWTPESRTGEDCRRAGTLDAGVANRRGLIPMTAALKEYIRRLAKEYRCDSAGDDERRTGYLSLVLPLVVNQAFKELHALGYDDRKFLDKPGAIVHEWQDGSFEVVIYDSKEELLAAWDGWVVAVRDGVPADFVFDPTAVPAPPQSEAWTQFCLELERARHACSLALDFLAVLDRNGDLDYYAGSDTLTTTRDALRGVVRRHETDPKSADAAETSSRTRT